MSNNTDPALSIGYAAAFVLFVAIVIFVRNFLIGFNAPGMGFNLGG